jgi:two-component system nitrogen regulation response regulator NtrX
VALQNLGHKVHALHDPIQAFKALQESAYDLAIIDIRMEGITGLELFSKIRKWDSEFPTIIMSGHASLSEAAEAIKMGAFDFLEKPFSTERLTLSLDRCLEMIRLRKRVEALEKNFPHDNIVGESPSLQKTLEQVKKVADTPATVLIQGESGTGKELIAKAIHDQSPRRHRPFIKVNCAAIPENLIESELFGHVKGAFTGADSNKKGFFQRAHAGTLFLDEIGEMSLGTQAKVLRALQSSEIQMVGGQNPIFVDVRIITATNKDLKGEVDRGDFREDLFYRLNVVPIKIPALRERREDIPLLATHFINSYAQKNNLPQKEIDSEALVILKKHTWPGNIRELQNLMERLYILSDQTIKAEDLPDELLTSNPIRSEEFHGQSLKEYRDQCERQFIIDSLKRSNGNISQTAKELGIERTYLHKRIGQFQIEKREYF